MATTTRSRVLSREFDALERTTFAVALYVAWVAVTWLLEKRVGLFARYDPIGRSTYALVANVLVGTVVAAAAARRLPGALEGLRVRPLLLLALAIGGGVAMLNATPPAAREPTVLVNAFAQILPTSIAEVMTSFLLVGAVASSASRSMGKMAATAIGVLAGDAAFAVYHFAHSPPFDQPAMVAFLAMPGLVTALLVLVARDLVSAVLAQNLFAMIGITKNADLDVFRHPFFWAYAVAFVACVVAASVASSTPRARAPA